MTTAKQLDKFSLDRGMSYEDLARQVSAAAGYPVSAAAIWKFCVGRTKRPGRVVRNAIEKFMAQQKKEKKVEARA